MNEVEYNPLIARRFRGFLPVVVDVETAGFDARTDALLEIAAVILHMDEAGQIHPAETHACHVEPFPGANLDPRALAFNGIDPDHPFRDALPEAQALKRITDPIRKAVKASGCNRAILVGHNAFFDLGFI
ncbi:MAG: ribonuclease T, partial [Candidatus Sedimenticola endophacoides]